MTVCVAHFHHYAPVVWLKWVFLYALLSSIERNDHDLDKSVSVLHDDL